MAQQHTIQVIAHIRSDFHTKFGIPRQSGLVDALRATVVFEPEYRNPDSMRVLGGNTRMGVFATRSPFRPNPIGLSCVALEGIQRHPEYGPVLLVRGADLMDGTPIYDIKPYLPYADCHPEAAGGFASQPKEPTLQVEIAPELLSQVPEELREALLGVLAQDPRPQYQHRPDRVYGLEFGPLEVKFTVEGELLTVRQVQDGRRG